MTRLNFVTPSDPILTRVAASVTMEELKSPAFHDLIEALFEVAYGEQRDRKKPVLVGLAAPQVGVSKRIILVDVGADGRGGVADLRVFINPKITWKSEEKGEWYEGCFSTDRVCGIVDRPISIRISALDRDTKLIEAKYSGYVARIFQHEIDHLDGREFVTLILDPAKLHWVEEGEFPQYRDKEAWRDWSVKCTHNKWDEIKSGKL